MSDFTLSLLFNVDKIFDLNKFSQLRSDFMIVLDFSFIYCFLLGHGLLEDKATFCLADYTFFNAISTFLAILSTNFFQDNSSALTLFLFLSKVFFVVVSTFFAIASAFLISLFCV